MKNPRIDHCGNKYWCNKKGQFHREDGPAIECKNGDKEWWIHGKISRLNGPAIEYKNGSKAWYINGRRIRCKNNEDFLRIVKLILIW